MVYRDWRCFRAFCNLVLSEENEPHGQQPTKRVAVMHYWRGMVNALHAKKQLMWLLWKTTFGPFSKTIYITFFCLLVKRVS